MNLVECDKSNSIQIIIELLIDTISSSGLTLSCVLD